MSSTNAFECSRRTARGSFPIARLNGQGYIQSYLRTERNMAEQIEKVWRQWRTGNMTAEQAMKAIDLIIIRSR